MYAKQCSSHPLPRYLELVATLLSFAVYAACSFADEVLSFLRFCLCRYIKGVDLNAMAAKAKAAGTLDAFMQMLCVIVFKVSIFTAAHMHITIKAACSSQDTMTVAQTKSIT